MNTVDNQSVDLEQDQSLADETSESTQFSELKISGYDGGTRNVWKEPSLYLSIAVILIASIVCLSKSPTVFWLSFVFMSAVAVMFHVVAERHLFKARKEFSFFAAPFEGVFVVTFGSILPGIALLAYGVYALATAAHPNVFAELGKLALLLVVPLFNLAVWSAVRKKYLVRPRLAGLMNGLALGLSASWTAIWIRSVFFAHGDSSCKFGWMLLLFTSPFLLFSAICLGLDLWQKTEENISRITRAFSMLGCLLSLLFAFAPMARSMVLESLVNDARNGSAARRFAAINMLRSLSTDEDLRPSLHAVSGFSLAQLLMPDRGLDTGRDSDKDVYFKITGRAYSSGSDSTSQQGTGYNVIDDKIPGLSLAKSQISGNIDASTLSGAVDWMLSFHNATASAEEARCEIAIPKQAAVSRVTLWINGEPHEGAFAPLAVAQQSYDATVRLKRDPLLVTRAAPDRVSVQCFPVPANGGDMRIRIGFKMPVDAIDGKRYAMALPKMLSSNFAQPKRHRFHLVSNDMPVDAAPTLAVKKSQKGYTISGIVKMNVDDRENCLVTVQRTAPFHEFATPDWYAHGKRYIVERLQEVTVPAPKRLLVVVDASASLRASAAQIREALSALPARLKARVYLPVEQDPERAQGIEQSALPLEKALLAVKPEAFVGGQSNEAALRDALETAAEQPDGAVLWIHGPQPIALDASQSSTLDLVNRVRLFDLQIADGPDNLLRTIKGDDVSGLLSCQTVSHDSVVKDVKSLVESWANGTRSLTLVRSVCSAVPGTNIIRDASVSAQVTALWANGEVTRLLDIGRLSQAHSLAQSYRLVTPVTGAVVLESEKAYTWWKINPGMYRDAAAGGGGLIGAPVDPRYGQTSEVGQMADFGYDTARDLSRFLTFFSFVIAMVIAMTYLRGQKSVTNMAIAKAAGLVVGVPFTVHLIGSFMINNFGGLGAGL